MIIGNGDIASALKDRSDRLYFASGVSNSKETRESEYQREENLLMQQEKSKHIIYFSSLCVFSSDSRYAQHKRMMEKVIMAYFEKYTIIRLGNITFGKNPNTIINFFKNKIARQESFEIQDTYRYLVDKDELLYWIDSIPDWSCELSITGRRLKVSEIVEEIKAKKL